MAPTFSTTPHLPVRAVAFSHGFDGNWRDNDTSEDFIIESWSQGFMVGALIIMACVTVANMRRGVTLHKLILLEQLLAMSHGTFAFFSFSGYGWYLSSTATLLYCSWFIHNIVAWMKIKPFFVEPRSLFKPKTGKWVSRIYISTLVCTIPPIILQIFDNFRYFNNINALYKRVRPYEPLMRDPWWVFTCITLFHVIAKCYGTGTFELVKRSPRFGILLAAIVLAMIFTVMDIVASIVKDFGSVDGINPYWKLSLVFKCLTDTIMLDDFKTELKRLGIRRLERDEARRQSSALVLDDEPESKSQHRELEFSDALDLEARSSEELTGLTPNGKNRKPSMKQTVGRAATKISPLPSLGKLHFQGAKPSRKRKEDAAVIRAPDDDSNMSHDVSRDRVSQMRRSLGVVDYHQALADTSTSGRHSS